MNIIFIKTTLDGEELYSDQEEEDAVLDSLDSSESSGSDSSMSTDESLCMDEDGLEYDNYDAKSENYKKAIKQAERT